MQHLRRKRRFRKLGDQIALPTLAIGRVQRLEPRTLLAVDLSVLSQQLSAQFSDTQNRLDAEVLNQKVFIGGSSLGNTTSPDVGSLIRDQFGTTSGTAMLGMLEDSATDAAVDSTAMAIEADLMSVFDTVTVTATPLRANSRLVGVEYKVDGTRSKDNNKIDNVAFDLGLSNFNLSLDGLPVAVNLGYSSEFSFEVREASGFRLLPQTGPEVELDFEMRIEGGGNFGGNLGPIGISVSDNGSVATAEFDVDFDGGATTLNFSATADLHFSVSAGPLGGLEGDFRAQWNPTVVNTASSNSSLFGALGNLSAHLSNVEMTAGAFSNGLLTPLYSNLQSIVSPFADVTRGLEGKPFAGTGFGATVENLTYLDIIKLANGAARGSVANELKAFLPGGLGEMTQFLAGTSSDTFFDTFVDVVGFAGSSRLVAGGNVSFGTVDVLGLSETGNVAPVASTPVGHSAQDDFNSLGGNAVRSEAERVPGEFKLEFPILDNPSLVFQYLLGERVDLVRSSFEFSDPRLFDFTYSFTTLVGIIPVFVRADAGLGVDAGFHVGVDTQGIYIDESETRLDVTELAGNRGVIELQAGV